MPRWTEELGAFALDREGMITLASPLAESMSGIDLELLLTHHYLDYIEPAGVSEARAIFDKVLGGQKVEGVSVVILSDGSELRVGYTAQPDRRTDGEIVGITGTVWLEK